MGLYNLGMFSLYRDYSLLYFGLACLTTFWLYSSMEGLLLQFFDINPNKNLALYGLLYPIILSVVFDGSLFVPEFLNLRERMPRSYLILRSFGGFCHFQ